MHEPCLRRSAEESGRVWCYSHLPPSGIDFDSMSPLHVRSQVDPPEQLTEQDPSQVMWQIDPPEQVALPLLPRVTVQLEPLLQSRLHDSPQAPVHSVSAAHFREQLLPSHELPPMSHASPALHTQLDPAHSGREAPLPQRAAAARMKSRKGLRSQGMLMTMEVPRARRDGSPDSRLAPRRSIHGQALPLTQIGVPVPGAAQQVRCGPHSAQGHALQPGGAK